MFGNEFSDDPEVGNVPDRLAYPINEVAILLGGLTERYVWDLIKNGRLKSYKDGRRRFVPREDLFAYVAERRRESASAGKAVA